MNVGDHIELIRLGGIANLVPYGTRGTITKVVSIDLPRRRVVHLDVRLDDGQDIAVFIPPDVVRVLP